MNNFKNRSGWFFFACLLLLLALISNLYAQEKAPGIRIMTYNIWFDNPQNTTNPWLEREPGVLQTLDRIKPDVLCLQEALSHQVEALKKAGYKSFGSGRDDGKMGGEFSAILYRPERFDVLDAGQFWLSEYPDSIGTIGWDAMLPRICTWMKLQDLESSTSFYVFNTHFSHVGKVARKESIRLIMTKIADISGDLPVVLTGDFNFKKGDPPYRILENMQTGKSMLDSRYTVDHPSGPEYSFIGSDFTGREGDIIDHIFVSKDILVKTYSILENCENGRCPSDHLPVVALIQLLNW
jgi:endonuclease/exonuclease/phosphatase family metal-dependent hydrolase